MSQCRAIKPVMQKRAILREEVVLQPLPYPTQRCQFDALRNHEYCEFHIWIKAKHKAKP